MNTENITIGFIGQGWIGKHYADDFEARLYNVVRYALEEPYAGNKDKIKDCEFVFIAVPTPSTPEGFDFSAVESALSILTSGTTAIIKSTMLPSTTEKLQEKFPKLYVTHSPEFLREASAAHDAANPERNIVGIPKDTPEFRAKAEAILRILPTAPYNKIMSAKEAELVKYAGNCFLYTKVVFMNILHDVVEKSGGEWANVREAMIADPRIGESHTEPVHRSGHAEGGKEHTLRGAGGHCFIKDFEAFREYQEKVADDSKAQAALSALIEYNNQLLIDSNKDLDLLTGVHGEEYVAKRRKA